MFLLSSTQSTGSQRGHGLLRFALLCVEDRKNITKIV